MLRPEWTCHLVIIEAVRQLTLPNGDHDDDDEPSTTSVFALHLPGHRWPNSGSFDSCWIPGHCAVAPRLSGTDRGDAGVKCRPAVTGHRPLWRCGRALPRLMSDANQRQPILVLF